MATNGKDMTGQRFGKLTVLRRDESKPKGHGHKIYWICQCDCGNITSVIGTNLRKGLTKSCGCLQKQTMSNMRKLDITGKQYGFLVALYPNGEKDKNGSYIWHCKCLNCGNFKDISVALLQQGHTKSCGCLSSSYGELKIKQLLENHSINFIKEYSFDDCVSNKNYKLRFDFAIFKNTKLHCLIEVQGIQHTIENNKFDNTDTFSERQQRDNIKRQYCIDNNILLVEIPYSDIDSIQWEELKRRCNL